MAATASYRAVPSMLIVAPTGSTKRMMRRSMWLFSRRHLKVIGSVAELEYNTRVCHLHQFKAGRHDTTSDQICVLICYGSSSNEVPVSA